MRQIAYAVILSVMASPTFAQVTPLPRVDASKLTGVVKKVNGGTGATTLENANLVPAINVTNTAYGGGAKCNNSTDDRVAIQAAINAATAGQIVQLPTGVCKISSPGLTIGANNLTLQGMGRMSSWLRADTTGYDVITVTTPFVTIRNLGIFNNTSPTFTGYGINCLGAHGSLFEELYIWNINGAISLVGCENTNIRRQYSRDIYGGAADYLGAGGGIKITDSQFDMLFYGFMPVAGRYRGAWVTATAYTAGDTVTSHNGIFVAANTTTSGATAPVLTTVAFNTPQSDGAVNWWFLGQDTLAMIYIDAGANGVAITDSDLSGPAANEIRMVGEPQNVVIDDIGSNGSIFSSIRIDSADHVKIVNAVLDDSILGHGIEADATRGTGGISDLQLFNNTIRNHQQSAVYFQGGGATHIATSFRMFGGYVANAGTPAVALGGTTTDTLAIGVSGFNPQDVSAITPGASPYTYTNADVYPELVSVQGGTVSNIQYSRTSLASVGTSGTFLMQPGDALIVTYTVAPTMNKIPQ